MHCVSHEEAGAVITEISCNEISGCEHITHFHRLPQQYDGSPYSYSSSSPFYYYYYYYHYYYYSCTPYSKHFEFVHCTHVNSLLSDTFYLHTFHSMLYLPHNPFDSSSQSRYSHDSKFKTQLSSIQIQIQVFTNFILNSSHIAIHLFHSSRIQTGLFVECPRKFFM